MSKREVPKLNKDNFPAWRSLMKLQLAGFGDHAQNYITTKHVDPTTPLADDMRKKKEHNQAMLEIPFTIIYAKFDDIKHCDSIKKMWDTLHTIYGVDANVLRAKFEIPRGKFDDMRMHEGDNIAQYCSRIKDVVNAIR